MICVFIKDKSIVNNVVFSEQNDSVAELIRDEHGYDNYVWCDEAPLLFDHYENGEFVPCPEREAREAAELKAIISADQ